MENRSAVCNKLKKYLLEADDPAVKDYFLSALEEVLISNDGVTIKMKGA